MSANRFLSAALAIALYGGRIFVVAAAISLCTPLSSAAQEGPLTTAEASGFKATSRHGDVMRFIAELQGQSPLIRVESMAVTVEGRDVPLVIIGDPVPYSPAELRHDDRTVVYFQANIHAGEVEGKEAAQMLARDIVQGKTADYLDGLVILICPNFNPDGNEKISTDNRRRQVGPEQGVGIRYNGQNLDLNRDGMKLETPEVRGLVENVLTRWDPLFFLDSHTHNGSYHQEPVTWTWGLNPNGDAAILEYMEHELLPDITSRMTDTYEVPTIPHGDFLDVNEPEKGWVAHGPEPRYLVNYVGLRNRFSILNEQYPYVDFETRVQGCYKLFLAFLDHIHANRHEMEALASEADRETVARGEDPAGDDAFIVEYDRRALDRRLTILGYEMEVTEREGTWPLVRPTEVERVYKDVPYFARYAPKRTVGFPRGYLVAVHAEEALENLLRHGIIVEELVEPVTLEVESFTVTRIEGSERPNQGHYTSTVEGEYSTAEMEFPEGTLFVRTGQPLGRLAAYLLEPESGDGLVAWNYFDRYLAAQWGNSPQAYPVYKLYEAANTAKRRLPTE
jgi:hypothetical protein